MLKITIIHPQIPTSIVKYIDPGDILDWLSAKYDDVSTLGLVRPALANALHAETSALLPVYATPDLSGAKASLVLKGDFLSNCMITVEECVDVCGQPSED